MNELHNVQEGWAFCEKITDKVTRDLVQHSWRFSISGVNAFLAQEGATISLDFLLFVRLFAAIAEDPESLIALASGEASYPIPASTVDLVTVAEASGVAAHGEEALAHVARIEEPKVRALVAYGLIVSLRWLIAASASEARPATPVDLLLHAWMLAAVFQPTHAIAYMAAGKPDLPWIEFDE